MRQLAAVQHSKHLMLLRFLKERYSSAPECGEAVAVLMRAERRDERAVADLLSDPMVGAWAVSTTRRIRADHNGHAVPLTAELAQFGALAAAAAVRAGEDAEVRTRALFGTVTLPTLGGAVLGSNGPAVVTVSGGRARVIDAATSVTVGADNPRWRILRRLVAHHGGLTGSLAIEDGNPYRSAYHVPAAGRLRVEEVRHWQECFTEAWQLLAQWHPERAAELTAGLRSVVPLVSPGDGVARSGTARDSFGILGLTPPTSGADLAVTLVHEFQHSKLSALLDVAPLYRPDGEERHFAPWRADARPTGGLIQGVYAFLGVADTWRALRSAPGLKESATREFAIVREQVAVGLTALEGSAELTTKGRRFTAGLRQAVDALSAERVPRSATDVALRILDRRRNEWRRDNPNAS
ncbi:HEXXH motif domain-containing protein [Phytohabitans sp. ZYX-F-186]|uniref:HEXXH motif domain-containing protein n=1 Tax=Phytohabitans maris TaxID=3071409 RepID=A0ABU0ZES3_9ACTN|nr:HEXXH motif domain-containing protein [Phytohabitans sp. ZYX-F-186]MDQ7904914.1 HEXXH motif domain-containing protein [Phytohabitans sp. ZYX-F-186]